MNEALILGSVRQDELIDAAEHLNAQLRAEIAQRKHAEQSLRESEERFRELFASAPMPVFACDRDGLIQQYNSRAADLLGREPVRGIERFCDSLRLSAPAGSLLQAAESPVAGVLRTGFPVLDLELCVERDDGSRVAVLANFAPLQDDAGAVDGAIASFLDLTERKKREQQSLRSQRLESIGMLAGGIAHDLNNSLGPILVALELLRMKFPDPESQELLDLLSSGAQRGSDMVRQVLSFARGVDGRRADVDLAHVIKDIEKIVNETFLQLVKIETCVPRGLWTIVGDSTQIHQVLLNLCMNARDAMPHGGTIVISAENQLAGNTSVPAARDVIVEGHPCILVKVQDSGSGMSPEIADQIFDPFFTTKEFGKGSGLGLSTSLAIVKSHGGSLDVESELGKGSIFHILFPARADIPVLPPKPAESGLPRGNGELVLVVDDEEPMRRMVQRILEMFGYRAVVACDGREALAMFAQRSSSIAAVLSDMAMPRMQGPELIRILRTMNPKLAIIGASGLSSNANVSELSALGVKQILSKPFTTEELLKAIRQALQESQPEPGIIATP